MEKREKLNKLLEDLFREEWMDDEDWSEYQTLFKQKTGVDVDELMRQVEIGEQNGYNIDEQIIILKEVLKGN